VQPPGKTLLADAALARNQDGGIKGRHAPREGHQPEHRGTVPHGLVRERWSRRERGCQNLKGRGEHPVDAAAIIRRHRDLACEGHRGPYPDMRLVVGGKRQVCY
jgi:hypothetical protein